MANVSRATYIGSVRDGTVLAVLDDLPDAAVVRVLVELEDGLILSVIHPRSSSIEKGAGVRVVTVGYMETDYNGAITFYLKKE